MIWVAVIIWYLFGYISYMYFLMREKDVTVSDFLTGLLVALLGGILLLIILWLRYGDTILLKQGDILNRRKQ